MGKSKDSRVESIDLKHRAQSIKNKDGIKKGAKAPFLMDMIVSR